MDSSTPGYLVVHPGTPEEFRVELETGKILEIGRKANSANPRRLILPMPEVSGNHAEVREGSDGWTVRDLGSTNGTRLNGDWITPGQEYPLKNGDLIKIAQIDIEVNLPNGGQAPRVKTTVVEDEHEKTQFHIKLINATILVGDIRSFTPLMETYSAKPEVVMQAAQRVFQQLTEEIRNQHGQVEKVAGDAIMAYWQSGEGSQAASSTYAHNACHSAIRMQKLVKDIASRKDAWPFPEHPLQVDVALATGPVAAGVLGASKANPALLGDTANLAFRLEKLIGDDMAGEIIIDGSTYQLVKSKFNTEPLGSFTVKGRQRPVDVFSPGWRALDMASIANLEHAVGKLITGKVSGPSLDEQTEAAIASGVFAGVTLFKENAENLSQLYELVETLTAAGGPDFLIAVDQEGGAVQRFDDALTPIPSAMALAALNDDARVDSIAELSARQLSLLGVNCNLTPVLDVNSNPLNPIIATRSFGDNPSRVAHLAKILLNALQRHNVLAVGKHFPGHGDTFQDSHLRLAVSYADKQILHKRELAPFAELASQLKAVLTGHIWLPAYEDNPIPASLSYAVTTALLKEELGFTGFVLTDDLPVMRAIVDSWGIEEAAVMAVHAGADNVLVSGTLEQIKSVHAALLKAVQTGHISEDRVTKAITARQLALPKLPAKDPGRLEMLQASIESGGPASLDASASAVCTIKGRAPNVLLEGPPWQLVLPKHPRYSFPLSDALRRQAPNLQISEFRHSLNPDPVEIEQALTASSGKRCIMLTYRALLNKGQITLADKLSKAAPELTIIAVDTPYELFAMTACANSLATVDPSNNAMEGLALVLTGTKRPAGKCPVVLATVGETTL